MTLIVLDAVLTFVTALTRTVPPATMGINVFIYWLAVAPLVVIIVLTTPTHAAVVTLLQLLEQKS